MYNRQSRQKQIRVCISLLARRSETRPPQLVLRLLHSRLVVVEVEPALELGRKAFGGGRQAPVTPTTERKEGQVRKATRAGGER